MTSLGGVAVVIPALDEEGSLPGVMNRLAELGLTHIRVVDNGSRDGTADIAVKHGATVIDEPRRGYGQACWTGCVDMPEEIDWFLFCNADGSDDLEAIPRMLEEARGGADMVLGTRSGESSETLTMPQRWGNRLACGLIRLFWRGDYTDLGPLRLISRAGFHRLWLKDRGFGWTIEMQIRAVEEGLTVTELPVDNFPRTAGQSKISGTVSGTIMAGGIILSTIGRMWLRRGVRRRRGEQSLLRISTLRAAKHCPVPPDTKFIQNNKHQTNTSP